MTLTKTVEQGSTEFEVDLDALDRYGSYYVDHDRDLIIKASVYTHGTPDSRHLRGDIVCGTDYTFEPVDVDREQVRGHVREELQVEMTDEELEDAIAEYQRAGIEVVGAFDGTLGGYRILSKASSSGIVSTDTREPLAGWDHTLEEFINRVQKDRPHLSWRDIARVVLNALQAASPGDSEYSARITLVNATQRSTN